ncbi:BnaC01g14720D [Brassica napus]|uniref:BnaC01g14720D protein n=1 Tax=Brassica napus TaxID=3708 RepID=A0A078FD07_BRANA|nr:BnaC01g14720D [Brassica napus]
MFLDASGTMARRRRLYQPFRSMFLCSSPKFLSIGALVVLSRLKDSSTMLFSGESQIVTLVAFGACCITFATPSPLCFRSVCQTPGSVYLNFPT